MSDFTVHETNNEVYASTNKYMRFAIEVMEDAYTDDKGLAIKSHGLVAQQYDNLLPIELKEMNYLPAEKMMLAWINLFFSNKSRKGLIPTLTTQSGRRYYDCTSKQWVFPPGMEDGDIRYTGVVEGFYASRVNTIRRIHDFLAWFPNDSSLQVNCMDWAKAFMETNSEGHYYGHRVKQNSWQLYNYVHTGPPPPAVGQSTEEYENPEKFPGDFRARFDRAFRFALEGFPDSWWVTVDGYGFVAQSFVHLTKTLLAQSEHTDFANELAAFAKDINQGLWNARLNQSTYLMPDTVTPFGPLPGDQADVSGQFKYMHDTDCLYWARALFGAYEIGAAGAVQSNLQPSNQESLLCTLIGTLKGQQVALDCRIHQRRMKLDSLLKDDVPNSYLGMALGLTLDWIRYGWNHQAKQFIRKIFHDGTPGPTELYGDGKWNTLYILIAAYRFTHDKFYLDIFDQAWGQLKYLASGLGGLFPDTIENGGLPAAPQAKYCWGKNLPPAPAGVACEQHFFLDVIINAYRATVEAGQPKADYLADAETLANTILAEHNAGKKYYHNAHGILGGALVRLARAKDDLRRIGINLSEANVTTLSFTKDMTTIVVDVDLLGQSRAVVYMDDGPYHVVKHFTDNTTSASIFLQVSGDADVVLDSAGQHK